MDRDIAIEVRDPDLCPRYAGRVIRGVTVGRIAAVAEGPAGPRGHASHQQRRGRDQLRPVGAWPAAARVRPAHHPRGADHRAPGRRRAKTITTLDGELRELTEDMLVIADAERASVVAGIMGGLDSEITESTTDILLEGANFSGPSIMRTSAALGLRSEASTRYEKGLDPEMIPLALDMACSMFVELCGGEVSVGTIDVRTAPARRRCSSCAPARVAAGPGHGGPDRRDQRRSSPGWAARCASEGGDSWSTVPSFRADLEREIDLIEEVARIHGLDQIPSTLPARRKRPGRARPAADGRAGSEDLLAGAGSLTQVINYSFGDDKWPRLLRLAPDDPRRRGVAISEPAERWIRRSCAPCCCPGLLETARRNVCGARGAGAHLRVGQGVSAARKRRCRGSRLRVGMLVAGRVGERVVAAHRQCPSTTSWSKGSWTGSPPGCIARCVRPH